MRKLLIAGACLALIPSLASAQFIPVKPDTSYSSIGSTTYGSDGTSYSRVGKSTYGSDGSNAQEVGRTTYYTPPPQTNQPTTSYQSVGSMTYGSDGSTSQRVGSTTYHNTPGGKMVTCQTIGRQTYCN